MLYSNLLGNLLPTINQGWTETPSPSTTNIGSFLYNLFKWWRNMAEALRTFFDATVEIGGKNVSIWVIFGGTTIVVLLILMIAKKIIPLA